MIINQCYSKSLPDLTNPATQDKVIYGYEYIDEEGNKNVGTAPQVISSTIDIIENSESSYPEGTLYVVYE